MAATEIADRILRAYRTGVPIDPVRGEVADIAAAYAVQRATFDSWVAAGRRPAGQKIGLTAKAVQQQLGVDEPDYGALFADMILPSGATIARGAVLQPRIEPEIAFVLKSDLASERPTAAEVIAATDYVVAAVEICGSRIRNWDIRLVDTIADNASSGLVVLGERKHVPALAALAEVAAEVRLDGAAVAEGRGSACLGNPASAVAWLAAALRRHGTRLGAGDVVMSGAIAKMTAAVPGGRFEVGFGSFGAVSLSFAA